LKIGFRDFESIVAFLQDSQFGQRNWIFAIGQEYTVALVIAPPDAAPQLMKLCQTETLRILDQHDRSVGNVHSDFDDGS
jgi:hypothetical protein